MKRIFSDQNIAIVTSMASYLEQYGVESQLRNEYSNSIMGEVPFFSVYPELWVSDESVDDALALIKKVQQPDVAGQEWNCQQCSEANPSNFQLCWNCGCGSD